MDVLGWLLDSEAAVRWQSMRDLTDAPAEAIAAERARIPRQGMAATILQTQRPDGSWRREHAPAWLTTLFTLQLLRSTGIDPTEPIVEAAMARLQTGLRWNDLGGCWELRPPETGGNTFFEGEEEPCINGGALAAGAYFGRPSQGLVQRLLEEQLEDGGWNCEAPKSRRSSFHTTLCVLEGLLEYERTGETTPHVALARGRGNEYLLQRLLYRRLSTGEVANPKFLQFAFPPRYHYDVLRSLDYFRASGGLPDPRMKEAVDIVQRKRLADGRWPLDATYDESLVVTLEEAVGQPSRWNTLRALRVLRWACQQA